MLNKDLAAALLTGGKYSEEERVEKISTLLTNRAHDIMGNYLKEPYCSKGSFPYKWLDEKMMEELERLAPELKESYGVRSELNVSSLTDENLITVSLYKKLSFKSYVNTDLFTSDHISSGEIRTSIIENMSIQDYQVENITYERMPERMTGIGEVVEMSYIGDDGVRVQIPQIQPIRTPEGFAPSMVYGLYDNEE